MLVIKIFIILFVVFVLLINVIKDFIVCLDVILMLIFLVVWILNRYCLLFLYML